MAGGDSCDTDMMIKETFKGSSHPHSDFFLIYFCSKTVDWPLVAGSIDPGAYIQWLELNPILTLVSLQRQFHNWRIHVEGKAVNLAW